MPKKKYYTAHIPGGNESDYESDGGTKYNSIDSDIYNQKFIWVSDFTELGHKKVNNIYVVAHGTSEHDFFLTFITKYQEIDIPCSELNQEIIESVREFMPYPQKMADFLQDNITYFRTLLRQAPGGEIMCPKGYLGQGSYCFARLFKDTNTQSNRTKVVLAPLSHLKIDEREVNLKIRFYQTMYQPSDVKMLTLKNNNKIQDYRLIVPHIKGTRYDLLPKDLNIDERINLFILALDALQECHNKGMVFIDLKLDNIFYDETTNKSYLVDGGLSQMEGEPLSVHLECETQMQIRLNIRRFTQIAPECWSVAPNNELLKLAFGNNRAIANYKMDTYSLISQIWVDLINKIHPKINLPKELAWIIHSCTYALPELRPTLSELRTMFRKYYPERSSCSVATVTSSECSDAENTELKAPSGSS